MNTPNLCVQLMVFSDVRHVFNEMLERAFIHIFGRLTDADKCGRQNSQHSGMNVAQIRAKSRGC